MKVTLMLLIYNPIIKDCSILLKSFRIFQGPASDMCIKMKSIGLSGNRLA